MAEFTDYLRTVNNRDGRPYEEKTIEAYLIPCRNLDRWLTAKGIEGYFTVADTALLNRYFREYYLEHGQGGTHTLQRNLIQLFSYLQREHGHPTPYGEALSRYAEVKGQSPRRRNRVPSRVLPIADRAASSVPREQAGGKVTVVASHGRCPCPGMAVSSQGMRHA